MLFHFEFRNDGRWETIGSGEGAGEEAALRELCALAGGTLPAGTYRCIAARSDSTRWESLSLAEDGTVGPPEELATPAVR